MNLNCRLKAYAKLSVGTDPLKSILSSDNNEIIDLGYRDKISNKKVFAVRRNFSYMHSSTDEFEKTYSIKIGENINKVYSVDGSISVDNSTYIFSTSGNRIHLDNNETILTSETVVMDKEFKFYLSIGGSMGEYISFDIYFIFTLSSESILDIGNVVIDEV